MNPTTYHQSKKHIIVGFGQTGLSVAEFFSSRKIPFDVQDIREIQSNIDRVKALNNQANVFIEELSSDLMARYDVVVASPGVSIQSKEFALLDQNKTEVIGDIELFARFNNKPVVAITGSNGKTTVTTLMGEVLKACGAKVGVGGNIGTPALNLIDEDNEINVLELSSFQLETTSSLEATISVVLNVSEDHMDRYENFDHYVETKLSIHNNSGFVIINRDDENTFVDVEDLLTFGLDEAEHEDDFGIREINSDYWLCQGDVVLINADDLKIKGQHNWSNCLAVLAMADALDLSLVQTLDALLAFEGIEHRYELVAKHEDIEWINDSKGTNPGATLAAIEGTANNIVLIAGGQSKQADLSVLNEVVQSKVSDAIVLGEDAELFVEQWHDLTQIHRVNSIQEAVVKAHQIANSHDSVLMSPACASLDQYKNYLERGEDFRRSVRQELGL